MSGLFASSSLAVLCSFLFFTKLRSLVAKMSNTIFFFIFGLTVGILLSISLVSHYGKTHIAANNNIERLKVTESSTSVDEQNSKADILSASNVDSTSSRSELPKPATSESFWVPGREGAFLKFKNNNSAINAEYGSGGSSSRRQSIRGKGGNIMNNVIENAVAPESVRVEKTHPKIITSKSGHVINYKGGDNAEIQSNFFSDRGERVDLSSLVAKDPSLADIKLYDHPPLVPYHSQAYQEHPIDPPYIPSLASVIKQRAATQRKDSASSSKFASLLRYLLRPHDMIIEFTSFYSSISVLSDQFASIEWVSHSHHNNNLEHVQ